MCVMCIVILYGVNQLQVGDHSVVKESVEQRYQRLQHELRELADDVNRMKVSFLGGHSHRLVLNLQSHFNNKLDGLQCIWGLTVI